jgi:hypothetical protein
MRSKALVVTASLLGALVVQGVMVACGVVEVAPAIRDAQAEEAGEPSSPPSTTVIVKSRTCGAWETMFTVTNIVEKQRLPAEPDWEPYASQRDSNAITTFYRHGLTYKDNP